MASFTCPACGYGAEKVASLSAHVAKRHRADLSALLVEAYTDRRGPDDCWPWRGTRAGEGYAVIVVDRRQIRVSSLLVEVGPGQEGCHTCDWPPCANPALFAGTRAENQQDKARKGRSARGEGNGGGGRLTEADVRQIRARLIAGETGLSLAREFGVSRTMVSYIKLDRQWRHVA